MARKIVITSGKGGVGKTTIVASLGIALALKNQRVLLVDLDVGLNNLDLALNIENKIVYDFADVLENKCVARQALIQNYELENMYVLPSSHFYNKKQFDLKRVPQIIDSFARDFDFILIDCPAGVEGLFSLAVQSASEALVVVTPHLTSLRDADKVISILNEKRFLKIDFVINRFRGDLVAKNKMFTVEDICEILKLECVGVVPEMDEVNIYTAYSCYHYITNKKFEPFTILADNILKDKRKLIDCVSKYRGCLGALRRSIKSRI